MAIVDRTNGLDLNLLRRITDKASYRRIVQPPQKNHGAEPRFFTRGGHLCDGTGVVLEMLEG